MRSLDCVAGWSLAATPGILLACANNDIHKARSILFAGSPGVYIISILTLRFPTPTSASRLRILVKYPHYSVHVYFS